MIYNAQRKKVRDWQQGQISTCPDCQRGLFARRGDQVIWHWSHYPNGDLERASTCGHSETPWHLAWKQAYDLMSGWSVEYPVGRYRADAVNLQTRNIREFIHSLSAFYDAKHRSYASLRFNVIWIFDGNPFVSERRRPRRNGGYAQLLKPRAYDLHVALKHQCWVHWDGDLWKEWKDNVWYPRTDQSAPVMLDAYRLACMGLGIDLPPQGAIRGNGQAKQVPHMALVATEYSDRIFSQRDGQVEDADDDAEQLDECAICGDFIFTGNPHVCSGCRQTICYDCLNVQEENRVLCANCAERDGDDE